MHVITGLLHCIVCIVHTIRSHDVHICVCVCVCKCPLLVISQWFTGILKVPNTSSPGVAGFVSWTAVSSVFIAIMKLLPLSVTMVIVPPGSVACTGVRRCSLC